MAVSIVVYRFDELPVVEDILFYLGHVPTYSDVPVVGKVFEGPHEQSTPFYNVFRVEDDVIEDDNLYVLFVFNPTTEAVECTGYLPKHYQDAVTSEIADWMMMINGTDMRHYCSPNGNFLFVLRGVRGEVNSMFSLGRRKTLKVVADV